MVAALVIFSTVACVALAFVYQGTKPTIDAQAANNLKAAQQELFPGCDFTEIELASEKSGVTFDTDTDKSGAVTARYQWSAAKDGQIQGVLVRAHTAGFQDAITALVGVDMDGKIKGVNILSIADTPGLGMNAVSPTYYVDKATKTTFSGQFAGMPVTSNISVQKDGGDVVALTAATISSRAISLLVNEAAKQGWAWLEQNR
jgi:electron transport complex protein RnfG